MIYIRQPISNKYHRPVGLLLDLYNPNTKREKSMLKFKPIKVADVPQTKEVEVQIILDKSSSMGSCWREAINMLNSQINNLKRENKTNNYATKLGIKTFNQDITTDLLPTFVENVGEVEYDPNTPLGMTALFDAINSGLHSQHTGPKLMIVITDGIDNSSDCNLYYIQTKIKNLDSNWTLVACCPPGSKHIMQNLGFANGNITEWENSVQGTIELNTRITSGITTTSYAYNAGQTSVSNYFNADLNVAPEVVKTNLDEVTLQFVKYSVSSRIQISTFISSVTRRGYKVGSGYYELTKPVEVQSYKDIIIEEKKTGKLYTGDSVRALLRLPAGGTIKLGPTASPEYRIYIASTSHNRILLPDTHILVRK